jgi:hypothetical protein
MARVDALVTRNTWRNVVGRLGDLRWVLRASPTSATSGRRSRRRAFASHHDLPRPPVDVVELEPRHLRRAQTETSDEHQHGEIAGTDGARAVTAIEQPLHLWRGQPGRDTRVVPSGDRRDRRGQSKRHPAVQVQEPQQRPELRNTPLRRTDRKPRRLR